MTRFDGIRARLTSFAAVHAANGILGMIYTLAQTLIFARVLDTALFTQTIAIATMGIYIAPLNQAVARANFVLLTSRGGPDQSTHMPESAAAFQISQGIMLILTLFGPLILHIASTAQYAALACFLFFIAFSNLWILEMQMMMIATGHALMFEWLTLTRKVLHFGLLALLWCGASFLLVAVLLAITTFLFNAFLILRMRREGNVFGLPVGLTRPAVREHLQRFWFSLQATFGEWLALSGPYALITAKFGVGSALIAVDTMMKLVRTCVTISRNMSEIVLMRVSLALRSGSGHLARPYVVLALGGGWAAALMIGGIGIFDENILFNALLGPNNILPTGAGQAIALAMFSGCGFAIGSHLVGHTGQPSAIRRIMYGVVAASVAVATATLAPISILAGLWLIAGALTVASIVALYELQRLVRPLDTGRSATAVRIGVP